MVLVLNFASNLTQTQEEISMLEKFTIITVALGRNAEKGPILIPLYAASRISSTTSTFLANIIQKVICWDIC